MVRAALVRVFDRVRECATPSIVESGCGQSTVIFASGINQRGGRLTTYEHDPAYADVIRKQLDGCGSTAHVDLRVVPLVEPPRVDGLPASKSHDLPDNRERFDVALIGGPPYWAGEAGRYHPLKWSADRRNPGGAAYLDGVARIPKQRIVTVVKAGTAGVVVEEMRAEKGPTKLTRN